MKALKALIVGTGGVGESMASIAKRRDPDGEIFERIVLADYDLAKAQAASLRLGKRRFPAEQVDGLDPDAVAALAERYDVDVICNLLPVYADVPMMKAAVKAQRHYLDTGMCADAEADADGNRPPISGSVQFAFHHEFERIGKLALWGQGIEPGMVDYFARYAADHYFDTVEEMGVRDGATLEIPGFKGMAFVFSIWTTIDECTVPAIVWEADKGYFTVDAFSEPEEFLFPGGIGVQELGHVEHDEVLHIGRNAHLLKGVRKATFKYGVGQEFIDAIEVLKSLNMTSTTSVDFRGQKIAPRDFLAAVAPDPSELCKRLVGETSSGLWVRGTKDGLAREIYLYQLADAEDVLERLGMQVITAQTAFTAVITLEMLATGKLAGYKGNPESGVRSPEEFCADPYVALMADYEFPGGIMEMESEYRRALEQSALTMPLH